jgi:phage repressor protein C with HTH and peptisase S24 domain
MTAKEFTEQLEINSSSVSEWKKGKMKPTLDTLVRISLIFNVTLDWLITGNGGKHRAAPLLSNISSKEHDLITQFRIIGKEQQIELLTRAVVYAEQRQKELEQAKIAAEKNKYIIRNEVKPEIIEFSQIHAKVFSYAAGAGPGTYLDGESPYDMISCDSGAIPDGADFGIRISGCSMEPLIHDQSIVWVKSQKTLEDNDIGIFILDNEALCKKLELDHDKRKVRLISLNQEYEPIIVEKHQSFEIVGKVLF